MLPRIVSISRRTDIPALHAAWLRERIEAGWLAYANPFTQQPVLVNLAPEAVRAIVFWTRNPHPLLPHLDAIDARYPGRHYLHLTITGMGRRLEPRGPRVDVAVAAARALAARYGPDYVRWRFDPIIVSDATPLDTVTTRFADICVQLAGVTRTCTVSFIDRYGGALRGLRQRGIHLDTRYASGVGADLAAQAALLADLCAIASGSGITVQTCAESPLDGMVAGVQAGRCIDAAHIAALAPGPPPRVRATREGCGCADALDVGAYDTCGHGCVYCYANHSPTAGTTGMAAWRRDGHPLDSVADPFAHDLIT